MAWFFADTDITTEYYTLSGEDAAHISRSLRMKVGEEPCHMITSQFVNLF